MDRRNERSMQDESINFSREMFDKTNAFNKEMAEWQLGHTKAFRAEDFAWAREEAQRQREFAQMGIQWKMNDARAAGLHPVAALGGSGASSTPIVVGGGAVPEVRSGGVGGAPGPTGSSHMANALGGMGQNIARALVAAETAEERERRELELEHMRLRNRLVDAQITETYASIMGQPQNPPMASTSSGVGKPVSSIGAIQVNPSQVTSHAPGLAHQEAGATPFTKRFNMGGGASIVMPSQAAAESLEALGPLAGPTALTLSGLRHWFHGPDDAPSSATLPPGWKWEWSPFRQSFQPVAPARSPDLSGFGKWRGGRGNARTR